MDPALPQLSSVTSESLQATIRRLLPSQQGFGAELAATNVITPIIDLTPSAEGSTIPTSMQQAINFGGATAFNVANATTVIISNTGFYRVFGTAATRVGSPNFTQNASFTMTDGATTKTVWGYEFATSTDNGHVTPFDFIVFLATGESISAVSNNVQTDVIGSTRQIADVNGVLTNPVGFTPQ